MFNPFNISKTNKFISKIKRKIKKMIFFPYTQQVHCLGESFQFFVGTFEGSLWYGKDRDRLIGNIIPELEWTKSHIDQDEIIADVGAHHGYFTLLYSK